jgi:hypothetical protein
MLLGTYQGASFASAFNNPSKQDLVQIVNPGGKVVFSLDAVGVAHTNPTNATASALVYRGFGSSLAAHVGTSNPGNLDLFTVVAKKSGALTHRLDSKGVVHTS